jgi:hypothetical protein
LNNAGSIIGITDLPGGRKHRKAPKLFSPGFQAEIELAARFALAFTPIRRWVDEE